MIGLDDLPPLLTPAELARLLRTTTNSLASDRYQGTGVPFIKNGRRVLYSRDAVREYLQQNTMQRTDEPASAAS